MTPHAAGPIVAPSRTPVRPPDPATDDPATDDPGTDDPGTDDPGTDDPAIRARFAWRGVAEGAVLILILLAIDGTVGAGHRFQGIEPHPFGLAVLLVAAQYGTAEAAATAILASAALLAFNVPAQAFDQDHYDWLQSVVRDPLLWLATSLMVGEITGRTRQRARESTFLAIRREAELGDMVQASGALVARVKALETRIAGQQRTVTSIYEAARAMGPDRAAVLSGSLTLIRAAIGATKSSVYLLRRDALTLAAGDGWDGSERGGDFMADSRFFDATVVQRRFLVANTEADRDALNRVGLMAAPIVTADGAVLGVIVVEAIGFTQLHLGAVASFRSVCEWVGTGLQQAETWEAAQQGRFLVEGSSLVASQHADRLIGIMASMARRIGFDLMLLQIDLEIDAALAGPARRTLVTVLEAVLRDTDLLIEGDDRRLRVLLPAASTGTAPLAAERLRQAIGRHDPALRDQTVISWLILNETRMQAMPVREMPVPEMPVFEMPGQAEAVQETAP